MRARRNIAVAVALLATAGPVAAAAAQDGRTDVVRVPFPRDDGQLTPYTFSAGYPLLTLVYDTLTWRDANGAPRPWLARSVRRGADPRTVRIDLREGARWHDGRPVTARDVAFTFRYMRRREHPRFTPQLREVISARAVDDDTLVVRLRRPSLGFVDQPLADVPILPRHLWADLPPDATAPPGPPIGSGPYRLERHEPGRSYTFRALPRHPVGRPAVERIEVPFVRRLDRVAQMLRTGRLDAAPVGPGEDARVPGVEILEGESYAGTVLMFNTAAPPFDRRGVRRAVAEALDLGRIARAPAPGRPQRSELAADRGYLHPESAWASPEPLHRPDPEAARVAFAELGVPPLTILASADDAGAVAVGRQVVLALHRVGARVRLVERPAQSLAAAVGQDGGIPGFQAAVWPAAALASHDPAFLQALFGSGEPLNLAGYSSEAFDRLAGSAARATSEAGRRRSVAAQIRLLSRDLPVVPLAYPEAAFAYRPAAYDGWVLAKGGGILDKRSFVEGAGGVGSSTAAAPSGDPLERREGEDGGLPLLFLLAAGVLALLGLLAAVFRRRSPR